VLVAARFSQSPHRGVNAAGSTSLFTSWQVFMPTTIRLTPLEASSPFEMRLNLGAHVSEAEVRKAIATGGIGFLHSFTTGSTVDGPGVRLVAWTAGCMWRCLYCHNPDTWTMTNGIPVTIERAVEELKKYRFGLQIMSGGLTISGGEPLMQHHFVTKLLAAAKALDIHTTIETNGYYGERLTNQELESIDLVMLGIKTWDPQRHRHLTGMEIGPTLEFARRLAAQTRPIWIRFVLVPGLTDDRDDIAHIARFAAGLGNVERVEVLPFHQLGRFKWKQLGLQYTLETVQPPSQEMANEACAIFRAEGLKAS
jgi:pyruvate formate lyase activating enzyme